MTSTSAYNLNTGRPPVPVLAVRPKTLAPPPFYVPPTNILPPTKPVQNIPRAPVFPVTQSLDIPVPKIASPVGKQEAASFLYLPGEYQEVLVPTASGSLQPEFKVVFPTVSPIYVPTVVPSIEPKYPPQVQTRLPVNIPISRTFPTANASSYPSALPGFSPPLGENPALVQTKNTALSRNLGVVSYSSPVNVSSYAMGQETEPSPLERSEQPTILSANLAPISTPYKSTEPQVRLPPLQTQTAPLPLPLSQISPSKYQYQSPAELSDTRYKSPVIAPTSIPTYTLPSTYQLPTSSMLSSYSRVNLPSPPISPRTDGYRLQPTEFSSRITPSPPVYSQTKPISPVINTPLQLSR